MSETRYNAAQPARQRATAVVLDSTAEAASRASQGLRCDAHRCRRCGGAMVRGWDGPECLSCGFDNSTAVAPPSAKRACPDETSEGQRAALRSFVNPLDFVCRCGGNGSVTHGRRLLPCPECAL